MTTTTDSTPISPMLDELLEAELAFSTVVQRYYASHLSMSLVALEALGAPPTVLQDVFDAHERSYAAPRRDAATVAALREALARDGVRDTLAARMGSLVDGPATKLFHAIIRLAYALDVEHEGQIAGALADWEAANTVLPVPEPTRGSRRVPEVVAALASEPEVAKHPHSIRDLDATVRLEGFRRAVAELAVDDDTLDEVAGLALHDHLAVDDFFTLHMVTGAHAALVVAEHLDGELAARLAARSVQAMAAAHLAVGAPAPPDRAELDAIRHSDLPSWDEIAAAAVADRDAHVVKLTYVSRAQHRRTGDALYQHVAARVTGLLGSGRSDRTAWSRTRARVARA